MKLICIILSVLTVVFMIFGTVMYVNNVDNCRFFVSEVYGEEGTKYYHSVSDNIFNPNLYIAGAFWDIAFVLLVAVVIMVLLYKKKVKENPEIASIRKSLENFVKRRREKKQLRINELMNMKEDDVLSRMGILQSGVNIVSVVIAVLAIGCLIFTLIESINYGIAYGFQILLICVVFVVGIGAIFAIPMFASIVQYNEIKYVISLRSQESSAFADWEARIKEKRRKSTVVLVSIIAICSLVSIGAFLGGIDGNDAGSKTVVCEGCDRSFSITSEDGKSVSRRNLCENCYENMKILQDALDDWKDSHK